MKKIEKSKNKKLNKQKIKEYRKTLRSNTFDVENELNFNEDGEAIIECKIGKADNIFSKFDILKERSISDDFNNFLLDETEVIPLRHNLEVKIHVAEDFKTENESQIKNAIKRHYSYGITKLKISLKRIFIISSVLYLLGVLALIAMPFVGKLDIAFPLMECLIIVAWFCIWEGADLTLFNRGNLKKQQINMLRLYNAKLTFIKDGQFVQVKPDEESSVNLTQIKYPKEKIN